MKRNANGDWIVNPIDGIQLDQDYFDILEGKTDLPIMKQLRNISTACSFAVKAMEARTVETADKTPEGTRFKFFKPVDTSIQSYKTPPPTFSPSP